MVKTNTTTLLLKTIIKPFTQKKENNFNKIIEKFFLEIIELVNRFFMSVKGNNLA